MLLILGLVTTSGVFPTEALMQIESALDVVGFRKEVSSTIVAGKQYSITYEGPDTPKERIQELLRTLSEQHHLMVSIETEESIRFP